ncbi:MAG: 2-phospho-L-lactate guanylyltransferase [Thermoleophilaceae bacterium]|nr:2-phospho-L-lactate guanylyltransferase [Thermoleophilaceae bacterium]
MSAPKQLTVAILPVKKLAVAKSRLAEGLDGSARQTLATAMVRDALAQIDLASKVDRLIVATSDPQVAEFAGDFQVSTEDADVSHSLAAAAAIRKALELGASRVALLAGDCPLMTAEAIDQLITHCDEQQLGVAVVPDRDGRGTNALVLSPPTAIVPAFGPGSSARHLQLAAAADVSAAIVPIEAMALDIDTADDWGQLALIVDGDSRVGVNTENALAEIMQNRHKLPGGLAR